MVTVIPTHGAIARATFNAQIGGKVLMTLKYGNKSVPFGAIVTHGENKNGSIVAENGQVYLTGLPQSGQLQVSWGKDKNSNDYGGWYDTDHINLVQGSAFAGSLQSYKGSLYWNNVTYPFPLTTNTNVLDIGDKTLMPLPLKLYITPVGAAGGVVIKAGEVIARIHMYKIATLGSGNPRNFTWNIISNNNVVMPTGGCTVDSRNVTVDLPDFPGSAEIPLGVYCSSEQKLSFYLSGATTDSSRQVFANTAPDATKASGVGVTLMRNGKILATGENVSLGTVNKSKVPLGLSATYGQTGNKVSAGTVQSVIGVTFIYE